MLTLNWQKFNPLQVTQSDPLSVCLSVCLICRQLVFLYMEIVYIFHNDSLPFRGNDQILLMKGQATKKTFIRLPLFAPHL